jgi:hypothetical protein
MRDEGHREPRRHTRRGGGFGDRLAATFSAAAVAFLSVGGAWYFGAAVWWLNRHAWPHWSLSRVGCRLDGHVQSEPLRLVGQFLLDASPGKLSLLLALGLAIAARILDRRQVRR